MTTDSPLLLPDVNVLVALAVPEHVHHLTASRWWSTLDEASAWGTVAVTEAGFVRLMLNPRVVGHRLPASTVLDALVSLRADPRHRQVSDDSSLAAPRIDLTALMGHPQVTDLHLVNLVAGIDAQLVTLDRGIAAALAPADRRHVHVLPA